MNYVGKWIFHSIGVSDENGVTYMNAEEYHASPMPYIDETDAEAVADEIKERKQLTGSCVEICEDGTLYVLMPLPEGATQEEVDEAVNAGYIKLRNGMLYDKPMSWEERDGKLWFDMGIKGEVFDEEADSWVCGIDDNGYFAFITSRFVKEE